MSEFPRHHDVLPGLLRERAAWSDGLGAPGAAPAGWRSLADLDDATLFAEAGALVEAAPASAVPVPEMGRSTLADLLEHRFAEMRDQGVYDDLDLDVDLADVVPDPLVSWGADPLSDVAVAGVESVLVQLERHEPLDFDDSTPPRLADPFDDESATVAADAGDDMRSAGSPGASSPDEAQPRPLDADDLIDDIAGSSELGQPLRLEHHDPFEAELVDPPDVGPALDDVADDLVWEPLHDLVDPGLDLSFAPPSDGADDPDGLDDPEGDPASDPEDDL